MSLNSVDPVIKEFLLECDELLQRVSSVLQAFGKGTGTPESVDGLYRDIHTIKGTSQLFGFLEIGAIAHDLENRLEPIRKVNGVPDATLVETLFKSVDQIERMVQAIEIGKPLTEAPDLSHEARTLTPEPPVHIPAAIPVPAAVVEAAPPVTANIEAAESSTTVRVGVALLDKLMTLTGEMVLVRNQVLQYGAGSDDLAFLNLSQRLDVVTSEIQGEVMKTRMQPIGGVLNKFNRVVRDLARELNKKIDLNMIGVETELDKTLLEAIKDPIMHIVRNSCDHGIETMEERRSRGKRETGTISIRSYHEGGQVVVEINDDGRGLNREKIIAKAIEQGILAPERAGVLSEREAFGLIFAPGFSTAAQVTNVSGRGVGMDVAKTNIEKIGGVVELQSVTGKGTTIRLKIPLTLAIVPAMIIQAGEERFAIPQVKLVELVRVEKGNSALQLEFLQDKPILRLREKLLPLVTLKEVLGLPAQDIAAQDSFNIVVLSAERQMFGLIVDEVQDTNEVVVKPLSSFLKSVAIYSGATVLGDGSIALILDVTGIANQQKILSEGNSRVPENDAESNAERLRHDMQEFLLFEVSGSTTKHAIPLNLVHRLEEFTPGQIEFSGTQRVVRYRGAVLPLLRISEALQLPITESPSGNLSVIVTQKAGRYYGIEVKEILDILHTAANIDDSLSDGECIFGNLVTESEVVVIVDLLHLLDRFNQGLRGQASPKVMEQARGGGGRHILFAEDTTFFRKQVSAVLKRAGYEVTLAVDGAEAFALLEESAPGTFDLVLSDIEMPKMNGLEFARNVRANEKWKHLPMVAITTRFNAEHVEQGLASGFNAYLEKLNADLLLNKLGELLAQTTERKKSA